MTVYNRQQFLAAAIESVLAQTDKDFELLVWDDGSSDQSLRIAQSDYTFDLAGRLTSLIHSRGATILADYGWDYDAANRIIKFTSPDGTSDYNYDDRNQVLGSDHSYQDDEVYTYDNNGNRINAGYQTGGNNRLLSDGIYTYAYDAEGNRTTRTEIVTGEVTEYTWDYRNRLTGVVTKDSAGNSISEVEYGYDVYNRRIEKTVDPDGDGLQSEQTERFVYDGEHIALVFDENGEQTHRYLHGPQIDQVLAEEIASGEVRWALADNQGTVRDVIDNDGNVLNHITYGSFGQITGETNSDIDFRFSYTGREFDEETGQYYYRARYYDAEVERFISEDPIGFGAGDANLSRYVENTPTSYTDPSGLLKNAPEKAVQKAAEQALKQAPNLLTKAAPFFKYGIPALGIAIDILFNTEPLTKDPIYEANQRKKETQKSDSDEDDLPKVSGEEFNQNINGTDTDECQDEKQNKCKIVPLNQHLGGDIAGSNYQTWVSGSEVDLKIVTPEGDFANFDGLVTANGELHKRFGVSTDKHVIEAKSGTKTPDFFKQKDGRSPLDRQVDVFAEEAKKDLAVAKRCGYKYSFVVEDPRFAARLPAKLPSGVPLYHID